MLRRPWLPCERDCPTCRGTGVNPIMTTLVCPKCKGERKVTITTRSLGDHRRVPR